MFVKALLYLRVSRDVTHMCVEHPCRPKDVQRIIPVIEHARIGSRRFASKRHGPVSNRIRNGVLLLHPSDRPPVQVVQGVEIRGKLKGRMKGKRFRPRVI